MRGYAAARLLRQADSVCGGSVGEHATRRVLPGVAAEPGDTERVAAHTHPSAHPQESLR